MQSQVPALDMDVLLVARVVQQHLLQLVYTLNRCIVVVQHLIAILWAQVAHTL